MSKSESPLFLCFGHPSGKLDLDFPGAFKARVRELAGESGAEMEVTVSLAGQNATERQKRGFHAMVVPWQVKRGDSINDLKQWLLAEIFGTHTFKVPGTDAVITVLAEPHTSELTRAQYCRLIEETMRLAAEDKCILTAPDEYRKAKEFERKRLAREAAKASRVKCERCKKPVPQADLVVREREWSDGGQSGTEEIEVCGSCAAKIDGRAA